ncbi:N-acetylmuramoyl-L-alanine amidase [Chryseobacterium sp. CBSDS_008]|uniref:N-acetylmuramoyl-L-alanine amidase n=1 Tax=Chryseobacterium sp. CBSDS_008 TaxID=3415265 RepID=UPI003CF70691
MTGHITGNQNPLVGITYSYEIMPSGFSFGLKGEYEWYIYKKQKSGNWKDITGTPKTGEKVTYKFGEIALGIEFQMKVYEIKKGILPGLPDTKELAGTLTIIPASNKVPKIDKVVLFNRGAKDFNTASYHDTLIAQAHCIAMFNKEIEFHLWEDDAAGKGHDASINKNNRHTRSYKAKVNANGIAEVQIPLISDEKILRQIANQFMMKGDRDEGANHEYYVTATYSGKIQGASQVNVNVANPDYKGQPQNQPKPQPQKDTPKFPAGSGNAPKQPDPKGNIIEAVFIDDTGKELSKVTVGDKVRIRIHSKNMVGKHIQYVIWESDSVFHDEVYRSAMIKIPADICDTSGFVITKDIFNKGMDPSIGNLDSYKQNYFIEIISKDLSAESQKFGVTSDGLMEVERVKSAAVVEKQPEPEKPIVAKCFCNRKITREELKEMVIAMRKATFDEAGENFYKWNKDSLFTGGHEQFTIKTYEKFAEVLNKTFENYDINTCIRKIHFLGQCYHETGSFVKSVEGKKSQEYWYDPYRGRGFIHLTLLGNYQKFKDNSGYDVVNNPKLVSTNIEVAAMSSGWYWKYNDIGDINPFADKDNIFDTSRLVNKPNATKSSSIIGYNQRINAINALKIVFKYPQECVSLGNKEDAKEKTPCPSGLKSCICLDKFTVENGFIKHSRVVENHVSVIEHGTFKDLKTSIQKIILHRTAGGTTQACINAFKGGRKNKKGGIDHYGTHFVVGKDGIITQTANLTKVTWHCAGWNSKSVGIEVVGFAIDKDGKPTLGLKGQNPVVGWENLTEEQAKSVACLVKALLNYYNLDKSNIDCHEHLAPKEAGEGQIVYNAIKGYL